MAPSYPWRRTQPSASSSSSNSDQQNQRNGNATPTQRTINEGRSRVISATGIQDSPALNRLEGGLGVGVDSPSILRSRIASPRYSNTITQSNIESFQNENDNYPSPINSLKKGKSKGGWIELKDNNTPSPKENLKKEIQIDGLPIPRYDSRGYPSKNNYEDQYLAYKKNDLGLKTSNSQESLHSNSSEVSSTGAGVNEETSNFLSTGHANKQSYYIPQYSTSSGSVIGSSSSSSHNQGPSPTNSYPPNLDYSLSSISYKPYDDNHSGIVGNTNPLPSLYGDSRVSLNSLGSGESSSAAHFRQHDQLKYLEHGINSDSRGYGYSNFSISSKGGKKHLADMFSLPADPATWSNLGPEPDDDFHDPDYRPANKSHFRAAIFTWRGAANLGCLAAMLLVLVILFAGYPILDNYLSTKIQSHGAYNLGGINATGQIPDIGAFQLIDKDTPQSAYTWQSLETGDEWELIFSDEFNREGRTFFDGDDPYWEAVDLHYWQTNNLEWYDPRMVTTKNGSLEITLDKVATNGMNYTGAMISTWNRLCFTGGYVEASVSLPGTSNVYGLWPAIWSMGNLGRAGYGGSLDGMWPYSYDSCDVGTLPNQTLNGEPTLTTTDGDPNYDNSLSYLPGQRLSRCTCSDDTTHPGPKLANGTFRGRSAPEIDMFEATVDSTLLEGEVSQSGQWAPYNPHYYFLNTSSQYYEIYDSDVTKINTYMGSVYQQATSGLSVTDQNCYTQNTGCFSAYGFEYSPGADGYITWVSNAKKAWTVRGAAMGPNADAKVGQRLVSEEPMYLIMNLGISENFGAVDFDGLEKLWPVKYVEDM
uniref:GH16 domain-containing protein n=1 Tax=Kwoniella pini CBS 10737 TaxID=1296096 RepID=A0A1B9HZP7_9TREE|nr:uncharacterized protein I206_05544 [Kwoniella pini CBS 10737]OCF48763.1 hypothetical protein I206_05544 [Kwoniella pini CBS 10737]